MKFKCKNCGECCNMSAMISNFEMVEIQMFISDDENEKIGKRVNENIEKVNYRLKTNNEFDARCPLFDREGCSCLIYEVRPQVCRRFQCNREFDPKMQKIISNKDTHIGSIFGVTDDTIDTVNRISAIKRGGLKVKNNSK